jgi:hypothetical protein
MAPRRSSSSGWHHGVTHRTRPIDASDRFVVPGLIDPWLYPTHIERSEQLMREALDLANAGSFVDMDVVDQEPARWLDFYIENGGPLEKLTISSGADSATPDMFMAQLCRLVVRHGSIRVTATSASSARSTATRVSEAGRAFAAGARYPDSLERPNADWMSDFTDSADWPRGHRCLRPPNTFRVSLVDGPREATASRGRSIPHHGSWRSGLSPVRSQSVKSVKSLFPIRVRSFRSRPGSGRRPRG